MDNKPSVFISYNHGSNSLVENLVSRLLEIANVHWDKNLCPYESFTKFMKTIRKQDFVVLVVSDRYLRSIPCMYEVSQLMSAENWDKKALIIVEDSAKNVYKHDGWLEYIDYWEKEVDNLKEKIREHRPQEALNNELDKLKVIEKIVGLFLQKIADLNIPEMWKSIDIVVDRIKISAKRNRSEDLDKTIIHLVQSGNNSETGIAIATNRSRVTINKYVRKMKKDGRIRSIGSRGRRTLVLTSMEPYYSTNS